MLVNENVIERIQDELSVAPGLKEVIDWIEGAEPTQAELQEFGSSIRQQRLGRAAINEVEKVQAAFVRGADKIVRSVITQMCLNNRTVSWHESARIKGRRGKI